MLQTRMFPRDLVCNSSLVSLRCVFYCAHIWRLKSTEKQTKNTTVILTRSALQHTVSLEFIYISSMPSFVVAVLQLFFFRNWFFSSTVFDTNAFVFSRLGEGILLRSWMNSCNMWKCQIFLVFRKTLFFTVRLELLLFTIILFTILNFREF